MSLQNKTALALSELESYDPRAPLKSPETSFFCCPFCGDGKPRDAAHRCLAVNTRDGAFKCHRCTKPASCATSGKLPTEPKTAGNSAPGKVPSAAPLKSHLSCRAPRQREPTAPADYESTAPLIGTRGADYLAGRGIPRRSGKRGGRSLCGQLEGRRGGCFPAMRPGGQCNRGSRPVYRQPCQRRELDNSRPEE